MGEKLVTIAIPAYKVDFLYHAIASALCQTYNNVEVLVVDDKSPYDIKAVVDQFDDKRLHYVRNEVNLGATDPAGNWNQCISLAHGDFFALLCDDDVYAPTFVETLVSLAAEYPETNVFRARCAIVDKNGETVELYPSSPVWETAEDYMWHVFKGLRRQTISEFLYRTEHIRRCDGYVRLPYAWNADYVSIFKLGTLGGLASTNSVLVKFRMSGVNISSCTNEHALEKMQTNMEASQIASELIKKSGSKYTDLLLRECTKWKYHLDRDLISSIGMCEGVHVFLARKKYDVGISVFLKSFVLAMLNRNK